MLQFLTANYMKPLLLTISLLFWQSAGQGDNVISRGFDQLFSIGILLVVLYLLFRDWNKVRDEKNKGAKDNQKLISNNTVAVNNMTVAVREFSDRQEDFHEEQKETNKRLDKVETKLEVIKDNQKL